MLRRRGQVPAATAIRSTAADWTNARYNGSNLLFAGSTQTSTTNDNLTKRRLDNLRRKCGVFLSCGKSAHGGRTDHKQFAQYTGTLLPLTDYWPAPSLQLNAARGRLLNKMDRSTMAGNTIVVAGPKTTSLGGAHFGSGRDCEVWKLGHYLISGNSLTQGGTIVNAGALIVGYPNALGAGSICDQQRRHRATSNRPGGAGSIGRPNDQRWQARHEPIWWTSH